MAIEITTYSPDLVDAYNEFDAKFWSRKRTKNMEYQYWKFRGEYPNKLIGQVIALNDDKVIGISGNIHFTVSIEGKAYPSQWTFNHMVDPMYRGKGIAPLMHEEVIHRKPITFGSAPSPSASKSMARAGYVTMPGSWKVYFPKNGYEYFKSINFNFPILKWFPNPFFYLIKLISFFIPSNFTHASEQEYADLYHSTKKKNEVYNVLTPDFLAWRFRPFKNLYAGLKTFKNGKGSYYCGFKHENIYFIADHHANSFWDFIQIISHIYTEEGIKTINSIRFMMNVEHRPVWSFLLGFLPLKNITTIFYYTKDPVIIEAMKNKRFYYSYLDSDENI